MNTTYYKTLDENGKITTLYTNDNYDIMHIKDSLSTLNMQYKTDDNDAIRRQFLKDLLTTNNRLNEIISAIKALESQNIISKEVSDYLLSSLNVKEIGFVKQYEYYLKVKM